MGASDRFRIRSQVNDEFGFFESDEGDGVLRSKHLFDPALLYRLDPAGYVRTGPELDLAWDARRARCWDPGTDDAVETVGYWETVATARGGTPRAACGSGVSTRIA